MFTLKLVGKSDNPGNWSAINGVHAQQVVVASNFRKKNLSAQSLYIYIYIPEAHRFLIASSV